MESKWKAGPLPPQTYHWGGVQLRGEEGKYSWHFADFHGNYATLPMEGGKRVESQDVILYCNAIHCPNAPYGEADPVGGGPNAFPEAEPERAKPTD